jgi:quinol monooxygenase YgiN
MICLNVILTVKEEANISEVRDLLVQQSEMTLKEPGCVRFEVYHSESDPKIFILNERWASAEALDVHRNAEACSTIYFPKVVPLCDRVPHPSTLVE